MDELRIGMVGAGFAADFHALAYHDAKGVDARVVAVTSQREESRNAFASKFSVPHVCASLEEMLDTVDVDVIDLCVPTNVHLPMAQLAAQAGKHVVVEKPLTGYCGEPGQAPDENIGDTIPRAHMMDYVMGACDQMESVLRETGVKFMYAENWVYAPAVQKARRLMESSGGTVLRMVAEESHPGSHASYAKYWRLAGGGSLLRTGSHPVGGVCYMKQAEGLARKGAPIRPAHVMADTGFLTRIESFVEEPRKYLKTGLVDCEDFGVVIITFEDGSMAQVCSSDVVLGGIYNHLDVFLSTGRIQCRINPNDACMAYGPSEDSWGNEYLAEKISTRAGWNFASPDEHWASGYHQEIQDFVDCVVHDREPLSGWMLARDVVAVIFAAYVSASEGRRVEVPR
ncbi:MAG: Gfo/Idh/MocA family oxidoreductase [Armatimonadetes bacterium]|nr:Gfo/Idh/MocA family oxidoreductase [Armatimonadota bacterium]